MATLVEISKRGPRLTPEQKAEQKRNRTQARVGLASNVLGLSAGAAATGAALRDPRFGEKGAGKFANKIYAAGKRIPQPIARLTRNVGPKGAAALAGGALALQAGNVGGDVVANRVLARSAKQGQKPVKKSDGERMLDAYISKSDHTAGHGSIEKAFIPKGGAGYGGKKSLDPEKLRKLAAGRAAQKKLLASTRLNTPEEIIRARQAMRGTPPISKAYRRYDPEADRQRRLGLAAGTGAGGGLLLGGAAAKNYTARLKDLQDKKVRGIAAKHGRGKHALLLTGGALASGGLGAAAYRRGLSERNNPWN